MTEDIKTLARKSTKEAVKQAKKQRDFIDKQTPELERIQNGTKNLHKYFISCEYDGYSLDISYSGGKLVLNEIFRVYRLLGYKPEIRPDKNDKISIYNGFWTHPDNDLRLWIKFSSTVCRRVKVGTKMVEQPVYETVCDE